jgi:O-6-methylguanine DNA methyltransferase
MGWITTHSAFEEAVLPQVQLHTFTLPTRLGDLLCMTSPRGVALISFNTHETKNQVRRVMLGYEAAMYQPYLVEQPDSRVVEELESYLRGELRRFSVGVDLTAVRAPFHRQVLEALCAVDYGETTTYGKLARSVGRPGGARAVGQAVGMNPIAILVPCHRVLASDGSLGGYSAGLERKRALLELEGHGVLGGGWPSLRR